MSGLGGGAVQFLGRFFRLVVHISSFLISCLSGTAMSCKQSCQAINPCQAHSHSCHSFYSENSEENITKRGKKPSKISDHKTKVRYTNQARLLYS